MNRMKNIYIYIVTLFASISINVQAQLAEDIQESSNKSSKAWEVGIGGTVMQFSRVGFTNFQNLEDKYLFDMKLKHAVYGANIYVARELTNHFYVDAQGSLGFTKQDLYGNNETKSYFMLGGGFQWRFGEYFHSSYVDPYIRAGLSYMRKNFDILYYEKSTNESMGWTMENLKNKDGLDRKDLMPISLGVGMNTWFNDRIGLGLQGDYVIMPYKNVANSLQGSVRIMVRFGGKTKKSTPSIQYIEKIVEKPVIIEKEVVVEVPQKMTEQKIIMELLNNVNFNFDSDILTTESEDALLKIAEVLKKNIDSRFLITGYTDSKGSSIYNITLSQKRANMVKGRLIKLGVPSDIMKVRGVGDKVAIANSQSSNIVREGDRKVTIELISNPEYWDIIE